MIVSTVKGSALLALLCLLSLIPPVAAETGIETLAESNLLPGESTFQSELRGTGDLGVIIERAAGQLQLIEHTNDQRIATISGLGDLSHASVVFSRDARYAYVFGRDGGLTKVDLLTASIVRRIMQAGNSIGGAISQDGSLIAVSNYEPGGVRIFDADSLEMVADIPAVVDEGKSSKVVGLVDAPGNRFVFSLYDANQIWVADMSNPASPAIERYPDVGKSPYDALISPDGRYYLAGLFGEDGLALLDLWHPENGVRKVMEGYARQDAALPVYKMPHLEGWAMAGGMAFLPAIGQHRVLVLDTTTWKQIGSIDVKGQPVFVMARPDGRHVWVNFAVPDNQYVQVIDTDTLSVVQELEPGPGVLHMEFAARGEEVWLSVRDRDQVQVYDTATFELKSTLSVDKPSGIFFTQRAHKGGL